MTKTRRRFTREFKLQAVGRVTEGGESPAQVARDLGIRADTLRRWIRQVEQKGADLAFPGHAWASTGNKQVRQLMQENQRLREERDVLKKALGILSTRR